MKKIRYWTCVLAYASKGNPFTAVATIILFYIMFNLLESIIETLIFGNRFEHWLDIVFEIIFITYSCYTVYICGVLNIMGNKNE